MHRSSSTRPATRLWDYSAGDRANILPAIALLDPMRIIPPPQLLLVTKLVDFDRTLNLSRIRQYPSPHSSFHPVFLPPVLSVRLSFLSDGCWRVTVTCAHLLTSCWEVVTLTFAFSIVDHPSASPTDRVLFYSFVNDRHSTINSQLQIGSLSGHAGDTTHLFPLLCEDITARRCISILPASAIGP